MGGCWIGALREAWFVTGGAAQSWEWLAHEGVARVRQLLDVTRSRQCLNEEVAVRVYVRGVLIGFSGLPCPPIEMDGAAGNEEFDVWTAGQLALLQQHAVSEGHRLRKMIEERSELNIAAPACSTERFARIPVDGSN
jgi:hypothetical protein